MDQAIAVELSTDIDELLVARRFAKDRDTAALLRAYGIARLKIDLRTGKRWLLITTSHEREPWNLSDQTGGTA